MSITEIRSCTTFAYQLYADHPFSYDMQTKIKDSTTEQDCIIFEKHMRLFGITVHDGDFKGETACYQAAMCGNETVLRYLFKNHGSKLLTYGSSKGLIPLHAAVALWNSAAAHTIIGYGSPMNILTTNVWYDPAHEYTAVPTGATPLDIAIRMNSVALVVLLKLNGGVCALPVDEGLKLVLNDADKVIAEKNTEADEMIPYFNQLIPTDLTRIITRYAVEYPEQFPDFCENVEVV